MFKPKVLSVLAGAAVLASSVAAHATAITFTASGTGGDGPLSATADFTTGAGFIDVTLTNTLGTSVIRSAGQALSDISFTLSNAPGTQGTLSVLSGQLGNVSGSGVVSFTSGSPVRFIGMGPPPPGGTGNFQVTGNTILMEAIGGGAPSQMIAPAIGNGGTYTNVNNGFQQQNPYTIGPASFMLDFSGVTAATMVTDATFSFGTGPDTVVPGIPSGPPLLVPEPASLALLGTALAALGLYRHRKSA